MKFRPIICMFLCLLLIIPACAESISAGDPSVNNGCSTIDGKVPMLTRIEKAENAKAAFLYEITSDTVMYAFNADTQMYPSSLTKIMTALIVLERCNLSDVVTVRQEVLDTLHKDAAITELQDGEIMSVENLMYSMLVDSANDSTVVLADYACGSQEAFVEVMNQKAAEFGCTGTVFKNVHGLYQDGHLSTARDIAKILREAVKHPNFMEFFGRKYYTIPATNKSGERSLSTGNFLMTRGEMQIYYDSRVTGGRTGVDSSGLRSIAATAASGDMEMISVIIGSESIVLEDGITVTSFGGFGETSAMLTACTKNMSLVQLLADNQAIKQYSVENGDNAVVVAPRVSISAILPDTVTTSDLTYRYNDIYPSLSAPVEAGTKISTLEVLYNGVCIAQADLFAMNSSQVKKNVQMNRTGEDNRPFVVIIQVILASAAVLIVFTYTIRVVRRARLKAMKRKIRQQQRRSR